MLDMVYLFQLYYYTDVLGIGAAVAGGIVFLGRAIGSMFDLPAGLLADRTRSRFGRFRPWVVGIGLPLVLVYLLDFCSPFGGVQAKVVYAAIALSVFMMLFSLQNTPYSALGGVMSGDEKERASISSWRVVGSLVGGGIVAVGTLPLARWLGGSDTSPQAWFYVALVLAAAALPLMVVSGVVPKERVAPEAPKERLSVRAALPTVFRTPRALPVLLAGVAYSVAGGFASPGFVYYFKYFSHGAVLDLTKLGLPWTIPVDYSVFGLVSQIATGCAVLFVTVPVTRRFSAAQVATVAYGGGALLSSLYFLMPASAGISVLTLCALRSVIYAPAIALFWTLLARVADRTGGQATALVFGLACLVTKISAAAGNSLFGCGLDLAGYVPNATEVSASTLLFVRLSVSLVPAVFLAGAAALVHRVAVAEKA